VSWCYVIGVDYGYTDATAFCVVGWRPNDPTVYVVECYKRTELTPSDAADELKALVDRFKPERLVADIGGLGKGYAEEAKKRWSLPIEPAQKNDKRGYQKLFVGDLQKARIKVLRHKCLELLDEWSKLPWREDREAEAEGFDNHCSDACLYAWREAVAYFERERPPPPTREELVRQAERELEEATLAAVEREMNEEWWEK